MPSRKLLIIVAAGLGCGILLAGCLLFILAWIAPAAYAPADLTTQQRQGIASGAFIQHIADFGNAAQRNAPFTWTITESQINSYLASMDEIVAFMPGSARAGQVDKAFAAAALAAPAASLRNGKLTLMARQTSAGMVVSVPLSFSFTDDGRVAVHLGRCHIGHLAVPRGVLDERLDQLRQRLREARRSADSVPSQPGFVGVRNEDLGRMFARIMLAIDGEPIEPKLIWPIGHKAVRITSVVIADGRLTLHVEPIDRPAPALAE